MVPTAITKHCGIAANPPRGTKRRTAGRGTKPRGRCAKQTQGTRRQLGSALGNADERFRRPRTSSTRACHSRHERDPPRQEGSRELRDSERRSRGRPVSVTSIELMAKALATTPINETIERLLTLWRGRQTPTTRALHQRRRHSDGEGLPCSGAGFSVGFVASGPGSSSRRRPPW